jgi:hypothetical protein
MKGKKSQKGVSNPFFCFGVRVTTTQSYIINLFGIKPAKAFQPLIARFTGTSYQHHDLLRASFVSSLAFP